MKDNLIRLYIKALSSGEIRPNGIMIANDNLALCTSIIKHEDTLGIFPAIVREDSELFREALRIQKSKLYRVLS